MQFAMKIGKPLTRLFWQVERSESPWLDCSDCFVENKNVIMVKKVEDRGLERSKMIPWKIHAGKQSNLKEKLSTACFKTCHKLDDCPKWIDVTKDIITKTLHAIPNTCIPNYWKSLHCRFGFIICLQIIGQFKAKLCGETHQCPTFLFQNLQSCCENFWIPKSWSSCDCRTTCESIYKFIL